MLRRWRDQRVHGVREGRKLCTWTHTRPGARDLRKFTGKILDHKP